MRPRPKVAGVSQQPPYSFLLRPPTTGSLPPCLPTPFSHSLPIRSLRLVEMNPGGVMAQIL